MKLARVLAKHPGKLADTFTAPSDTAATSSSSAEQRCKERASVRGRIASESAGSTGREECWSCGVCYEHVCCPFTLPCGHTVCGSCLEQLLMRQATCPFCRVSVFQGCTFGRNVSMWSSIQARHPKEAAQLSNKSTVIRYDPSSPPHPPEEHSHPHLASDSHTGSAMLAGDRLSAFAATYIEPVLPIGRTTQADHVAAPPASQSTSIGRNIFSRLAGLAMLAPQAPQAQAAPRNSSEATGSVTSAETSFANGLLSVSAANGSLSTSAAMSLPMTPAGYRLAVRTTVRSTDRESRHGHVAATSDGHATLVQPEAELSHRVSNQPEVLRRAQAAFSDLRETSGRRQAQVVF